MAKVGPDDIPGLVRVFSKGTEHLISMAKKLEFAWDGSIEDPFRGHNMFARNLTTAYVSKFSDLSTGILDSIEKDNFFVYALCGRSLIETTATLRHYLHKEYKPLLGKGSL